MDAATQKRWLETEIPYRIRAVLAQMPYLWALTPNEADPLREDYYTIRGRCLGDAAWEGRLVAMRWLIEFIGIKRNLADTQAVPATPDLRRFPFEKRVTDFGSQFHLFNSQGTKAAQAEFLSKIWKGCSQSSMHVTEGSNHWPVEPPDLESALRIVLDYLDATIYSSTGHNALHYALKAAPKK
ncbi:MAG: hypothetical protein QOF78_4427 [Phycisphaerales bacterium]|jgi:hypothetical protein|nr:hypothetical protein [Phycisphaerales bacterium]